MKIKYFLLSAVLILAMSLSGCRMMEVDTLYSLPQPQAEYLQLQELINNDIAEGSEYSAPTVGTLRQTVQLVDLDGDGNDEALAFLHDSEQKPKICIYHQYDGAFSKVTTIEGEGTGILRVEYADLNGDGRLEIMVTWKMSTDIRILKAYSVVDWNSAVLLTANCDDFQIGELVPDGKPEIIAIETEHMERYVNMYSADAEGEITKLAAKLSSTLIDVERFRISSIGDNIPAIFVEGICESDDEDKETYYLTDICIVYEGELLNITMDSETGESTAIRDYEVYSTDIDGDGTLDVPVSKKVYRQRSVDTDYYVFDWYSYGTDGGKTLISSTYHCYNDGWYAVLPPEWREGFTVRRESTYSGERTMVLSQYDANTKTVEDVVTVYTLTDENRRDRATIAKRFVLMESGTVIYSAWFHNDGESETDDLEKQQRAIESFHLIISEWNVGSD